MGEHRFHTPDPLELDIQIPIGDISVETVDGDESYVSVTGADKLVEHTSVSLDGNRLSIIRKAGTKPFGITISIGEFSFGSGGLHVVAKVPHHSQATVATAAADMKLRGRYRSLETKSASGDLTVHGEIEGDATVKTVSGDVRVDQIGGELQGAERVRRRCRRVGRRLDRDTFGVGRRALRSRAPRKRHRAERVRATSRSASPPARTSTSMQAPYRVTSPPRSRSAAIPAQRSTTGRR